MVREGRCVGKAMLSPKPGACATKADGDPALSAGSAGTLGKPMGAGGKLEETELCRSGQMVCAPAGAGPGLSTPTPRSGKAEQALDVKILSVPPYSAAKTKTAEKARN